MKIEGRPEKSTVASNLRVLIVEDNHVNQVVAKAFSNGGELALPLPVIVRRPLEAVKSRSYDIVLMDVQMPGNGRL